MLDWIGWSPQRADVETFATEDAEDVGLCERAVDVFLAAPVVFRDGELGAGIVVGDPLLHHRNHLRRLQRRIAVRGVVGVSGVVGLREVWDRCRWGPRRRALSSSESPGFAYRLRC